LDDLQWGLNSYMLAFAALIVAAGRIADVFGRRRCLLAGAILFAVASLLCGIAPTLWSSYSGGSYRVLLEH
jgi:MFS family permease